MGKRSNKFWMRYRENLPQELLKAKAIVADRNQIISTAKMEAETKIRVAEERARAMVNQDEIVKQAQQKANDLLTQTQIKTREDAQSGQRICG